MDVTATLFSPTDFDLKDDFSFNVTFANTSSPHEPFLSPVVNKAINILIIIVMVIAMISLGCTMEVSKIKDHILKPKGVVIAVLSQFGVMPLTAFCLVKGFQLTEIMAVVILICGCCPGGSASNFLALALQGDMNLSIVMTSCSTVLALGMMPLLLYLYCQGFPGLQKAIPYVNIVISLALTLLPCGMGILINHYRPQYSRVITKVGLSIMLISITTVMIVSTVYSGMLILTALAPPLVVIAALMPFIGFTFGYVISSLCGLSQSERRTVAMETGCQNVHLCTTILKLAFTPSVMGLLFTFPMVYACFQLMEGGLIIALFRCYRCFSRKQEDKYKPASTRDELKELTESTVYMSTQDVTVQVPLREKGK